MIYMALIRVHCQAEEEVGVVMVFSLVSGLQERLGEMVDEITAAANAATDEYAALDDKQDEVSVSIAMYRYTKKIPTISCNPKVSERLFQP